MTSLPGRQLARTLSELRAAQTLQQRFVSDGSHELRTIIARGMGTGLGLAIAAENARLHGATLEVSTIGRSAFTLRLPRP